MQPVSKSLRVFLLYMGLSLVLGVFVLSPPPVAADMSGSHRVAVLGARSGVFRVALPPVSGVKIEQISSADVGPRLADFDTLAMLEACNVNPPLGPDQQASIVAWVRAGGKLLIHDSDRCVPAPDYSWLPYPFRTDNPGPHGDHSGKFEIIADSPLGRNDARSPEYIDTAAYSRGGESGDANVMLSKHPAWCAAAIGGNRNKQKGATMAYAYLGKGMIIYNGLDLDDLGRNEWLNKLWQLEISVPWDAEAGLPLPGLPASPG